MLISSKNTRPEKPRVMFGQISGHLMAQWCWHMKWTITDTEKESQGVGGEPGGNGSRKWSLAIECLARTAQNLRSATRLPLLCLGKLVGSSENSGRMRLTDRMLPRPYGETEPGIRYHPLALLSPTRCLPRGPFGQKKQLLLYVAVFQTRIQHEDIRLAEPKSIPAS